MVDHCILFTDVCSHITILILVRILVLPGRVQEPLARIGLRQCEQVLVDGHDALLEAPY